MKIADTGLGASRDVAGRSLETLQGQPHPCPGSPSALLDLQRLWAHTCSRVPRQAGPSGESCLLGPPQTGTCSEGGPLLQGPPPPKLEESRGTTQGNPVHNTHTDPTLKPAAPSAAWSAHQTQPGDCQGLVSEPVPREQALLTTGLRGRGLGPLAPFPRVTADLAESAGRVLRKQHCAWDLVRPLTWPPAVSPEDPPLCHFGSFTVPGTHTPLADK